MSGAAQATDDTTLSWARSSGDRTVLVWDTLKVARQVARLGASNRTSTRTDILSPPPGAYRTVRAAARVLLVLVVVQGMVLLATVPQWIILGGAV
eukprot:scaffold213457_cov16-Prasinocladus_malaysianus.AAC.1